MEFLRQKYGDYQRVDTSKICSAAKLYVLVWKIIFSTTLKSVYIDYSSENMTANTVPTMMTLVAIRWFCQLDGSQVKFLCL